MRLPLKSSVWKLAACSSSACSSPASAMRWVMVTVKRVPLPTWLCTSTVPFMRSTSFLTMGMPRPVPVTRLSVLERSRENSSKMCGRNSSLMPMPVSSITVWYTA